MEKREETSFEKITKVTPEESFDKNIRDTAMEEGLKQLFTMDNIEMKTDLSRPLILAMSRGDIYADLYHSSTMRRFIKIIEKRSVSNARKGRGELVSLVRNSQDVMDYDMGSLGAMAKVLGK